MKYTLMVKSINDKYILMDILKKNIFGKRFAIGNVFCKKSDDGKWKIDTSFYVASIPNRKWDAGKQMYLIEEAARYIVENLV